MNYSTDKEIWKDVKGYEGLYEVSSLGSVRSKERLVKYSTGVIIKHKGRVLKQENNKGYKRVTLSKNGEVIRFQVHRLVAMHFVDNTERKPHVNHLDGDGANNRVENLEWCTAQENEIHSHKVLGKRALRGEQKSQSKLTETDVIEIRDLYKHGYFQRELADLYKVGRRHISDIVNKKRWSWL